MNHKNILKLQLTSGSADGVKSSPLLKPVESSSLTASTSFSALNVSIFSCKVMNKRKVHHMMQFRFLMHIQTADTMHK
jgi:hypothetical protein